VPRGPAGGAAERVAAECRVRGVAVTARQIERWWSEGFGHRPRQRSLGRGHGTTSELPTGTVELVMFLRRKIRRGLPLERAGIAAFEAGFDLPERGLRRSLLALLSTWDPHAFFGIESPHTGDALDVAERMAERMVDADPAGNRRMVRNLQRHLAAERSSESADSVAMSVRTNLIRGLEGEELEGTAMVEMIAALGMVPALDVMLAEAGMTDRVAAAAHASMGFGVGGVPALRELAYNGDISGLAAARDLFLDLFTFAEPEQRAAFAPVSRVLRQLGALTVQALVMLSLQEAAAQVGAAAVEGKGDVTSAD
jgi:hypothetical protein